MSWMTFGALPAPVPVSLPGPPRPATVRVALSGGVGTVVPMVVPSPEDLGDALPALLQADRSPTGPGDRVPHGVVCCVARDVDQLQPPVGTDLEPVGGQCGQQLLLTVRHLHREGGGGLGEVAGRGGAQQ